MWEEWYSLHAYYVVGMSLTHVLHLQGVNIPDVLTVVQWRVPKDLNTLMQHFRCAGQDFSLQAVAVLLAEPKWFLEDHKKKLARKRKRSQMGKKKVLRARTNTRGRASNVSSSDNESDSEGENNMNTGNENNNILNGDEEGPSDVEEAIKSISIMAGGTGRGYKQTTDKVMRLFINTHLLYGRKYCCCFHSNRYYRTANIRKAFILDLIFCFGNHFPSLSSAQPPPCCTCCMLKDPPICCDICHVDLVHAMIDEHNNRYQVVPRGSNVPKRPSHALTWHASQFCDALYDWYTKIATSMFGGA